MSEQEEQAKEAIELMSSEIQPPDVSLIREAVRRRRQRRKRIRYAAAMGIVVVAVAGGLSAAGQLNDRGQEVVTAQPAQGEIANAETTTTVLADDETTTSLTAVATTVSSSSSISETATTVPPTTNTPTTTTGIEQGRWGLESIASGSAQVEFAESLGTRTLGNVPAWFELNEFGELSGEVLCNDFRGSYEFDGQFLRTSGVVASAVGCGEGQQIETLVFDRLWGDPVQVSFAGDDSNVMTWTSADIELTFIRVSGPSPANTTGPPTTNSTVTSTASASPTTVVDVQLLDCYDASDVPDPFRLTVDVVDFFYTDRTYSFVDATAFFLTNQLNVDVADFDGDGKLDTLQTISIETDDEYFYMYQVCGSTTPLPPVMIWRGHGSIQWITESRPDFVEWTAEGPGLVWSQTGGSGWSVVPIVLEDGAWVAGDLVSTTCDLDGCIVTTGPPPSSN